jgi:hypothetical protein
MNDIGYWCLETKRRHPNVKESAEETIVKEWSEKI